MGLGHLAFNRTFSEELSLVVLERLLECVVAAFVKKTLFTRINLGERW